MDWPALAFMSKQSLLLILLPRLLSQAFLSSLGVDIPNLNLWPQSACYRLDHQSVLQR